jgi:hypothetical protein
MNISIGFCLSDWIGIIYWSKNINSWQIKIWQFFTCSDNRVQCYNLSKFYGFLGETRHFFGFFILFYFFGFFHYKKFGFYQLTKLSTTKMSSLITIYHGWHFVVVVDATKEFDINDNHVVVTNIYLGQMFFPRNMSWEYMSDHIYPIHVEYYCHKY